MITRWPTLMLAGHCSLLSLYLWSEAEDFVLTADEHWMAVFLLELSNLPTGTCFVLAWSRNHYI